MIWLPDVTGVASRDERGGPPVKGRAQTFAVWVKVV